MGHDAKQYDRIPPGRSPFRIILFAGPIVLPLILTAGLDSPRGRQSPSPTSNLATQLETVLTRAADYCDKLDRSVLNFVCKERIEEWFRPDFHPRVSRMGKQTFVYLGRTEKHRFLYDYQLIRGREGYITESRVLLEDDKKKVHVVDAPLKTRSFTHAKIVMGPLGVLRREIQGDYNYKFVREERVLGDQAVVIETVPKPGVKPQHLFGTIWLRKTDSSILKIAWNPASIGNFLLVAETGLSLGMDPDILLTTEYGFEKNGVRFPSRYTAKEIYRRGKTGGRYQIAEVDVLYDEYQFFTVETQVDIRGGRRQP
jgi:hypothetical protein